MCSLSENFENSSFITANFGQWFGRQKDRLSIDRWLPKQASQTIA
ncbi:MAG: hypothetical protein R2778_01290 [Saprospiraceae bacterium]